MPPLPGPGHKHAQGSKQRTYWTALSACLRVSSHNFPSAGSLAWQKKKKPSGWLLGAEVVCACCREMAGRVLRHRPWHTVAIQRYDCHAAGLSRVRATRPSVLAEDRNACQCCHTHTMWTVTVLHSAPWPCLLSPCGCQQILSKCKRAM